MYTTFRINSTKNCRNLTGFRRISTETPLALTVNDSVSVLSPVFIQGYTKLYMNDEKVFSNFQKWKFDRMPIVLIRILELNQNLNLPILVSICSGKVTTTNSEMTATTLPQKMER